MIKNQVFQVPKSVCQALAVDRPVYRTRSRLTGSFDRTCTQTCTQPAPWADRPSGRPTEGNPLSGCPGRPGGRPAREPLLSGSGPGRPGGRPEGSTVKNSTVGRSTGRSTGRPILALSAANGQIPFGVINTPFERGFG